MTLTANPAAHGAVEWELETSAALWAEDVDTYATRLAHIGVVEFGGTHTKEEPGHAETFRGAGGQWVKMAKGGSFKIVLDLAGHGSTTEGTPAVHPNETFLAWMLGMENGAECSLLTSQTATGGTVSDPTTSGANGVVAGGVVFIGEAGDGDGDAQAYLVAGHAGSALDLLNNLRGAAANGAKICGSYMAYPPSDPTVGQVRGARFRLTTANMVYGAHGCFPMGLVLRSIGPNGRPQLEATIGVSRWEELDDALPLANVTHNKILPAPVAGGSLHVQAVGTTTRNDLQCSDFTIEFDLRVEVIMGPPAAGALVDAFQSIIGARHMVDGVKVTFVVDADDTTDTPVLPGWGRGTTSFLLVYTLSPTPGSRLAIVLQKVCSRTVPVQQAINNLNRFRFEGEAYISDTLTSELTRARIIVASG